MPPAPNPPGHGRARGSGLHPWPIPPAVVFFVGLLGGDFTGVFVGPFPFFQTHPFSPTLPFNPFPWPPPPPLFLGEYPANVGRVPVKGGVIIYPPWLLGDFPASQAGFIIACAVTSGTATSFKAGFSQHAHGADQHEEHAQ